MSFWNSSAGGCGFDEALSGSLCFDVHAGTSAYESSAFLWHAGNFCVSLCFNADWPSPREIILASYVGRRSSRHHRFGTCRHWISDYKFFLLISNYSFIPLFIFFCVPTVADDHASENWRLVDAGASHSNKKRWFFTRLRLRLPQGPIRWLV